MRISLLQLNIYLGKRLEDVITYIQDHDFDVIHLQEVAKMSFATKGVDCFETIIHKTGYNGFLHKNMDIIGDTDSYFGNATFYKPHIRPMSTKTIWLKPFSSFPSFSEATDTDRMNYPRSAIDMSFLLNRQKLHFINTHLAWGKSPIDEPFKLEQAKILADHIKTLKSPFVLSGDFNMIPDTKVVQMFDEIGINLTSRAKITNTLNPALHHVQSLFPKGLAVDYIYTSPTLAIRDFQLIDNTDLSDHYGLTLELEV